MNNWYGIRNGSAGKVATTLDGNKFHPKSDKENLTQKDLADKYEIAQKTMNNYMRLAKSIPELEDLVSTGKVTPTTALSLMKQLTPEEQAELIASMDTTQKLTQKEVT